MNRRTHRDATTRQAAGEVPGRQPAARGGGTEAGIRVSSLTPCIASAQQPPATAAAGDNWQTATLAAAAALASAAAALPRRRRRARAGTQVADGSGSVSGSFVPPAAAPAAGLLRLLLVVRAHQHGPPPHLIPPQPTQPSFAALCARPRQELRFAQLLQRLCRGAGPAGAATAPSESQSGLELG